MVCRGRGQARHWFVIRMKAPRGAGVCVGLDTVTAIRTGPGPGRGRDREVGWLALPTGSQRDSGVLGL